MDELDNDEQVIELANKIQRILEDNFLKDPKLTSKAMERAREIRKEIEAMGFMVTWGAGVDMRNPEIVAVKVILHKPKKNLSPELQKTYNKWLTEAVLRKNKKKFK